MKTGALRNMLGTMPETAFMSSDNLRPFVKSSRLSGCERGIAKREKYGMQGLQIKWRAQSSKSARETCTLKNHRTALFFEFI
jgi:hypothetical protein